MFIDCPKCRSLATIPVVFGKPIPEMVEAANHGLVLLAGCVIKAREDGSFIDRHCKSCGFEWVTVEFQSPNSDFDKALKNRIDQLSFDLHVVIENIKREFVHLGRHPIESLYKSLIAVFKISRTNFGKFLFDIIELTRAHHCQPLGDFFLMNFDKNWAIFNEAATGLAVACFELGQASQSGEVNLLIEATHNVEQRQEIAIHNAKEVSLQLIDCMHYQHHIK